MVKRLPNEPNPQSFFEDWLFLQFNEDSPFLQGDILIEMVPDDDTVPLMEGDAFSVSITVDMSRDDDGWTYEYELN